MDRVTWYKSTLILDLMHHFSKSVGNVHGLSQMESKVSQREVESKVSRMESNDVNGEITISRPMNMNRHRTCMAKHSSCSSGRIANSHNFFNYVIGS